MDITDNKDNGTDSSAQDCIAAENAGNESPGICGFTPTDALNKPIGQHYTSTQ